MFRWNGFGLIKMYILGNIIAPAHPLTANCGHGIFLSAFAKRLRRAQMFKKLGCGLRLGGFANCVCTASDVIILSIIFWCLYHYEASSNGSCLGRIVCKCFPHSVFLSIPFTSFWEFNTTVKCSPVAFN